MTEQKQAELTLGERRYLERVRGRRRAWGCP